MIQTLNDTSSFFLHNPLLGVTQDVYDTVTGDLTPLTSQDITDSETGTLISGIFTNLLKFVFNGYGFEAPDGKLRYRYGLRSILQRHSLVFGYFFISAGLWT